MGEEFTVGPYTVPSGSLVAYPFYDTLLNPKYYPDPTRWDPARSVRSDELYLGWGGGKHICKGQRLATLTMKLVAAYVLMRYDLAIVDEQGQMMRDAPVPDWNDFLTCRPKDKCNIRFTERLSWRDCYTGLNDKQAKH
jgi:sterol 14-demethylase